MHGFLKEWGNDNLYGSTKTLFYNIGKSELNSRTEYKKTTFNLSGLLLFEEKLYKKSNNCILDNYKGNYKYRKR